ncbi:SSI family serine proteinase inhibitor [Allosalinactinospora lopnorensis]|uniref:SSI family serine proteinase inhibitor n=1 Tax=Allosalinactinospora lopnorensis TaxID=1352348 RepID=UPI0006969FA8|nr:SSI family serine proteinase inhibitor [Allosalinactinospora lopnorensis]
MQMRQLMSVVRPALLAAGAGLLLVVPAAQAHQSPGAALYLSVEWDGGGRGPAETTLTCHPSGGFHSRAEAACAALDRVDGRFGDLSSSGGVCTMEYRPTTATAKGRWFAEPVDYRETFDNPCLAIRESSGVFDL